MKNAYESLWTVMDRSLGWKVLVAILIFFFPLFVGILTALFLLVLYELAKEEGNHKRAKKALVYIVVTSLLLFLGLLFKLLILLFIYAGVEIVSFLKWGTFYWQVVR